MTDTNKKKTITNPEHVVAFDCDDTLVMWNEGSDIDIKCPYDGQIIQLKRHKKHIKLLKDHFTRGCYIVVWSAGGKLWADAVVDALDLRKFVHHVMAKPFKFFDDLPATEVLGTRVYVKDTEE